MKLSERKITSNILYLTLGESIQGIDIVDELRKINHTCEIVAIPYGPRWKRLLLAFWICRNLRKYNCVISTEYNLSFAVSLMSILLFARLKQISIGFNLSGRPITSSINLVNTLICCIFQRIDLFIVHSKEEIYLFSELHKLNVEKFRFSSWGFDIPDFNGVNNRFKNLNKKYACMIGRNNRDFNSFVKAIDVSKAFGVIICGEGQSKNIQESSNVLIFENLSIEDCASCINYSFANVILVRDASRGAGHITAVMAMQLGKPNIFSNVLTLEDYLQDGIHGFSVPVGDVDSVAEALKKLLLDNELYARFGSACHRDGWSFHSHKASTERKIQFILQII